jgi:hypothetical protein
VKPQKIQWKNEHFYSENNPKIQGKNEHFYSDNSCTGYVPPSKAQKREIFWKVENMIVF